MIVLIDKQIQPLHFYPFFWFLNCFNLIHFSNKELVENYMQCDNADAYNSLHKLAGNKGKHMKN
jgi:hypothetical protein